MKKLATLFIAALVSITSLAAQNYIVVDSKKIFESLDEYTQALETIDAEGKSYQAQVDSKFDDIETQYNNFTARANSLSVAQREQYEVQIKQMEDQAIEFQESIFSKNGTLMKRRLELLAPIQTKVFNAIESYAKAHNYDLVLDEASTTTILYKSEGVDHTAGIIAELKKNKIN